MLKVISCPVNTWLWKNSKAASMGKDNNQRKRGELILLRKPSSNTCYKSGNTRFSAPQAHVPNTSITTITMCGAFLFSKDNTKPNFHPSTDQNPQRLDVRKICWMGKPFPFACSSFYSSAESQQQIKQLWQAAVYQDKLMSRKNLCCGGGIFLTWLWFLKWQKKKEKKETKPIPFNCLSKAGRFCHSNLMFQETQQWRITSLSWKWVCSGFTLEHPVSPPELCYREFWPQRNELY